MTLDGAPIDKAAGVTGEWISHRLCQIDGNIAVGRLIDQNGHTWHICAECIAFLWKWRQQENQLKLYEASTEESIDRVLALLREKLLGGADSE